MSDNAIPDVRAAAAEKKSPRANSLADHPLVQLTLVRFLEFTREPEALFWVFVFPLLLAAGLGIAAWRLASKKPIIQIMGGLVGVAISTIITLSSHQARGYFLYGMILNAVYGTAFLLSLLVNRPLLGYLVGGATGDLTGWVRDRQLRNNLLLIPATK